jgi:hypothetical protein
VDLFDVVKACFRRWYVVIPILVGTFMYSQHMFNSVQPVYYSQALIGLAAPNTQYVRAPADEYVIPHNGLLDVGGPSLISNMLVIGMRDPAVMQQVVAAGGDAEYGVLMFPGPATQPQLPLVMIEATKSTPVAASKTVAAVVAQADPVLRNLQLQAGVPEGQLVKALVVSPPTPPQIGIPSRMRSTIAIVAAGIGFAVVVAVLLDVILLRRKVRFWKSRGAARNADATSTQTDETSTQTPQTLDEAADGSSDRATEPSRSDESIADNDKTAP